MDKANLKKKVEELDDMVKTILGTKSTEERIQPSSMTKVCPKFGKFSSIIESNIYMLKLVIIMQKSSLKFGDVDFAKKREQSEKLLSRVNGELSQYHK